MISISTLLADFISPVVFSHSLSSDAVLLNRRHSRTATLDGESSLSDLGFTWSDVTLIINIENFKKSQSDELQYLVQNYSLITLSSEIGFFHGAIDNLSTSGGQISFNFLVTKKMA